MGKRRDSVVGVVMVDRAGSLVIVRSHTSSQKAGQRRGRLANNILVPTQLGLPAPVIDSFVPSVGSPLDRNTPIQFNVTDEGSTLRRVMVLVTLNGETFVVHDGDVFRGQFANYSTRVVITGGFQYSIRRNGGWVYPPTFEISAIDTGGNEAV